MSMSLIYIVQLLMMIAITVEAVVTIDLEQVPLQRIPE